jgi:hypothetical protein
VRKRRFERSVKTADRSTYGYQWDAENWNSMSPFMPPSSELLYVVITVGEETAYFCNTKEKLSHVE